ADRRPAWPGRLTVRASITGAAKASQTRPGIRHRPPPLLRLRPARRRSRRRRNDAEALGRKAMNPSRIFIERPVATSLLMIAILMVGVMAFRFLPLSALPEVDYPTIQVQTF